MGTSNLSSAMATSFKLISCELKVEFEIGDTGYGVVWSMDNINDEDAKNMVEENFIEDIETVQEEIDDENTENNENEPGQGNDENTEATKENKQEEMDKNTEALKKEKEFSKQADMFRESWGLQPPTVQPKDDDDETVAANDKDASDDQKVLSTDDTPEEPDVDGITKQFTLKLGAGGRSIKLFRKSSDSTPTEFSKSSEGLLPDEEVEDFCKAWTEAVKMALERRVAAGHSVEEIMGGFITEMGLNKFHEILEHFLGSLTMDQIEEDETDMVDQ